MLIVKVHAVRVCGGRRAMHSPAGLPRSKLAAPLDACCLVFEASGCTHLRGCVLLMHHCCRQLADD